jgi:soluble lytic murein transglycosylase-like protein
MLLTVGAWLLAPAHARAELVYLQGGRTLSVKSHRLEGDRLVLQLRGGGEIVCDAALVERVAPDEVPFLEPEQAVLPLSVVPPLTAPPGARPYDEVIEPLAARHGVSADLVHAVVAVESNYEPAARSPKGAMGLMQLMPATARHYGVANAYEPGANLDAGIRHLRSLLERFDVPLALAAYNAGEATIRRYGGIPPYPETRAYVQRVLARAGTGEAAGR